MQCSLAGCEAKPAIKPPLRHVLTQEACALVSREPTGDFSARVPDVSSSLCGQLFIHAQAHIGTHIHKHTNLNKIFFFCRDEHLLIWGEILSIENKFFNT